MKDIEAEKTFNKVAEMLHKIRRYVDQCNEYFEGDIEILSFSDSIIITVPYEDDIVDSIKVSTTMIISIVKHIQNMVLHQFESLIRGYVTKGKVYHKDGIIFGEGYIRAYKNEKSDIIGYAPRVVIDSDLNCQYIRNLRKDEKSSKLYIGDISTEYYYIDYLKPDKEANVKAIEQSFISLISYAKENIKEYSKPLTNGDEGEIQRNQYIKKKYKWLNAYIVECQKEFIENNSTVTQ